MSSAASPASKWRPRIGRPPRIDRDAIMRAAERMAADEISMANLAERMGVSVAALYQHFRGRDELLAAVGRFALTKVAVPNQDNLNWAEWLLAYACKMRAVLLRYPSALSYLGPASQHSYEWLDQVETALAKLINAGFTDKEAERAFLLVTDLVPGIVQREVGCAAEARELPHLRELVTRGPHQLPILLRLSRVAQVSGDEEFQDAVRTTLAGVAFRRGEASVARALLDAGDCMHSAPMCERSTANPGMGRVRSKRRKGALATTSEERPLALRRHGVGRNR